MFKEPRRRRSCAYAASFLALAYGVALSPSANGADELVSTISKRIAASWGSLRSFEATIDNDQGINGDTAAARKWLGKSVFRKQSRINFAFMGANRFFEERGVVTPVEQSVRRPAIDPTAREREQRKQAAAQRQFDEVFQGPPGARILAEHNEEAKNGGRPEEFLDASVYDGRSLKQVRGQSGTVFSSPTHLHNQFGLEYFVSIGWFVPDVSCEAAQNESQRKFLLPDAFTDGAYRAHEEDVGGVKRVILEGRCSVGYPESEEFEDTLWLDPSRGYMLQRREWRALGKGLVVAFVNTAPKEVIEGVWMPMRCEILEYAPSDAGPDLAAKVLFATTMTVAQVAVNNVKNDRFDYSFPRDTVISDFTVKAGKAD